MLPLTNLLSFRMIGLIMFKFKKILVVSVLVFVILFAFALFPAVQDEYTMRNYEKQNKEFYTQNYESSLKKVQSPENLYNVFFERLKSNDKAGTRVISCPSFPNQSAEFLDARFDELVVDELAPLELIAVIELETVLELIETAELKLVVEEFATDELAIWLDEATTELETALELETDIELKLVRTLTLAIPVREVTDNTAVAGPVSASAGIICPP